ncbi:MAG: 1D-myo-inositol 2-acetamido-2-deoxy-alpha-D-glucopyranoside deacetylase [Chroococcidiopsis sp. SAG 2025]|uniref:PIG-L deacetylase family protein n=1 Tax=Chroococcidiopsis sp. SAG 2025 TaxID=171389 RepID=UPI002937305F|nr:PIG-L deacetylase family protein [Chroococcidiopsis sp. SAG 2025]MDV2991521.1 1D-myo-inositol 2-acetamido-2-deoxy-alpha-D-glucopyranoside deacetylase [Chroococcidiopsis sp. SAG 2025]
MSPITNKSLFSDPAILPWCSVAEIASKSAYRGAQPCAPTKAQGTIAKSVLVVAPHPDDETLGCGGAIALLQSLECRVNVLVISDGTMSHPRSRQYPAAKLRSLREAETRTATATLGIEASAVDFLRLPDGAIPTPEKPNFAAAVEMCRDRITALKPDTIFLPWRFDPHPDHRATWQIVHRALVEAQSLTPRFIEYPIWDWDETQRSDLATSNRITAWRLDISDVVEVKKQAIAAYRSQTTNLIDDDPEGFRLTPEMLANFTRPWEVYIEEL